MAYEGQASSALLAAALGGLLAVTGCGSSSSDGNTGTVASGDTPVPNTQCSGGYSDDPTVTQKTVAAVTQSDFEAQCAAKNGIFEIQPHCGGSNACRGMSYDSETQTLTEHSCRQTNTCGGFSCVVCD